MRKSLLLVMAVAMLGALSVYAYRLPDNTPSSAAAGRISGPRQYNDGSFAGTTVETPYGELQVEAVIKGAELRDVTVLKLPDSKPESKRINDAAIPKLEANALTAQSADIDFVSGATMTSFSYQSSLQAALDRAANR